MAKQNLKLPFFLLPIKTNCPFEKVEVEIIVELLIERLCHHCNVIWRNEGKLPPCERKR